MAARGSLRLLFSPISRREAWLLLLPASTLSLATGALPALMTQVLGNSFDAFTSYNPSQLPNSAVPQERKDQLMRSILTSVWQLCALGAGTVLGNTTMITLWVIVGEKVAAGCRRKTYAAIGSRSMEWFDKGMGMSGGDDEESSSGGGAGGLMARFARETDDVRIAASQTSGQMLQHLAAMIACLALAFASNWKLTLVILSCIPVTVVATIATEVIAAPLMAKERATGAKISGLVERGVNAIATVKAFNAQEHEHRTLVSSLNTLARINKGLAIVWAARAGFTATLALSMFTSGFAYGSHLVQQGKASAGTVMTVFFSALIASGQLQLIIESLQIVEKGKSAAAALQLLTSGDLQGGNDADDKLQRDSCSSNGKAKEAPSSSMVPVTGSSASLMSVEMMADPFTNPPDYDGEPQSPSPSMSSFRSHGSISRPYPVDRDFVGILPSGRADAKDRWMSIENIPHSPPVSPINPLTEKSTRLAKGNGLNSGPTSLGVALTERPARRQRNRIPTNKRSVAAMRKIRPSRCQGEVSLKNLSFAYPSRPDVKVLQDVSLYFAAGETTYLVGGSGSGKSSVAALLLRMYEPSSGLIEIDEQDIRFLDPAWVKACVSSVDQHPIIFDLSVHDNVALGAAAAAGEVGVNHVPTVDREAVVSACRIALLHNFVEGLPEGYDTQLGAKGASISGGQKQRLAIARAKLRDSPVLILDEATSALDLTSRHLVNEAIKHWRKGKTTIIITHDLSSVGSEDFVYLLDKGRVAQQGYRFDLETQPGPFSALVSSQDGAAGEHASHGALDVDEEGKEMMVLDSEPSPTGLEERASRVLDEWVSAQRAIKQHSRASKWAQRLSWGAPSSVPAPQRASIAVPAHAIPPPPSELEHSQMSHATHRSSWREHAQHFPSPPPRRPFGHTRQAPSVASTASSSGATSIPGSRGLRPLRLAEQQQKRKVEEDEGAVEYLESASIAASRRRPLRNVESLEFGSSKGVVNSFDGRRRWRDEELLATVTVESKPSSKRRRKAGSRDKNGDGGGEGSAEADGRPEINASLLHILAFSWRTQPRKMGLVAGLIFCVVAGGTIPAFSFVLGRLLGTMGLEGQGSQVTLLALVVLALAFADGLVNFLRFFTMAFVGDEWIRRLRTVAFSNILAQDKAWFDRPSSSAGNLLTRIVKDGDDAQNFIGRIVGEILQVVAMITIGLVWAMITGWQLTLVGMAFAPVFILTVGLQSREVNKREALNKVRREAVAKRFYDMVANVRGIRSMALDDVFAAQFNDAVRDAERCAIRAAPVAGAGFGLSEALTYMAEALMYYVGAILVTRGIYDFQRMVTTFNLILFATTFAAQTLAFLPGLSKALRAAADLEVLVKLPKATSETPGHSRPRIDGGIHFKDVCFSYPSRPDVEVLSDVSFDIEAGQRVALVGGSGSGKSTVAALLQRLYEPTRGQILIDDSRLSETQTAHLREKLAVVSQHPNLFSATVEDNIKYGASALPLSSSPFYTSEEEAEKHHSHGLPSLPPGAVEEACKRACAHDFITDLPQAYSTPLGDNVSLSGGQAQRLAIARALVRSEASILILDECTSALDAENQARVAHNLLARPLRWNAVSKQAAEGSGTSVQPLTVLCVTHKLDMMRRCDVIIVMEAGRVVQRGTFSQLSAERGGAFARLASAGEWGA